MARKISKTETKKNESHKWIPISDVRESIEKKGKNCKEFNKQIRVGSIEIKTINGKQFCTKESLYKFLEKN